MKPQLFLEEILHSSNSFHTSTFLFRRAGFNIPACARSGIFLDNVLLVAAGTPGKAEVHPGYDIGLANSCSWHVFGTRQY